MPLYPQYSATTTASVFDAVYTWAAATRNVPELRFVNHYHDAPGYIDALARTIETHWKHHGQREHEEMQMGHYFIDPFGMLGMVHCNSCQRP